MGEGDFIKPVASSACRLVLRPLPLRFVDESFAPTDISHEYSTNSSFYNYFIFIRAVIDIIVHTLTIPQANSSSNGGDATKVIQRSSHVVWERKK